MSSKSIQHVSEYADYLKSIKESACMVKFTATWCGPCRAVAPVFQQLADENADKFQCLEIDIDDAQEITNHEDVKSIPYFVFYVKGERLDNLSLKGANKELLLKNAAVFASQIPPKEVPKVDVIIVAPQSDKVLDMSRLTMDDVDDSDDSDYDDDEEGPDFDPRNVASEDDGDEAHNEYGEDVDILIEKTIPEAMIRASE
jgi:thiol-disulfide isomerase/thioredoxin